jgi:hypothetical protein
LQKNEELIRHIEKHPSAGELIDFKNEFIENQKVNFSINMYPITEEGKINSELLTEFIMNLDIAFFDGGPYYQKNTFFNISALYI